MENQRPAPTWRMVHEIVDETTKLAVLVNRREPGAPYYSYSIGCIWNGDFKPFIQPRITRENGQVDVQFNYNTLNDLITQAQIWIAQDAIEQNDIFHARKLEVRSPGKTEREKEKRARHEQSQIQKAEENRARQGQKGKK